MTEEEIPQSSDTDESDEDTNMVSQESLASDFDLLKQTEKVTQDPNFTLTHSIAQSTLRNSEDVSDSDTSSGSDLSDTESVRTTYSTVSTASKRPALPYEGFASKPAELVLSSLDDVKLSQNARLEKAGFVRSILDNIVVIESVPGSSTFHLDSVLFLNKEKVLGRVFDVFGPVIRPLYSVRFDSSEQISLLDIATGMEVFIVPSDPKLTAYVFENELRKQKGTDASWEDNDEIPPEEEEFSDDEKEKEARQQRERNKRMINEACKKANLIPEKPERQKKNKPRNRKNTNSAPQFHPQEQVYPMMPPEMQHFPPNFQPFPPGQFPVRYPNLQMRPPFPQNFSPPPQNGGIRYPPEMPRMNLPRPMRFMKPGLVESVASLNFARSSKPVSDVPAVGAPNGIVPTKLLTSAPAGEKTNVILERLITDPKKLPGASSLFYDPKTDPALANVDKRRNLWRF